MSSSDLNIIDNTDGGLMGSYDGGTALTLPNIHAWKPLHYSTNAACFVFVFKKEFPIIHCKTFLREILAFLKIKHFCFEEVDHVEAKKHLRLEDEGREVGLVKCDAKKGLNYPVIVTVKGLVNMNEDEISMEVVESYKSGWPFIGVTGPDSFDPMKSRYGDQGVCISMGRFLLNKDEWDDSLLQTNAIKKGDVIRMVVKNHTLIYYHNNEKLTFEQDPITLLKNRDYKFAVEIYGTAVVRIV